MHGCVVEEKITFQSLVNVAQQRMGAGLYLLSYRALSMILTSTTAS